MHATGPDGVSFNVTRRWAPWRPRLREDDGSGTLDAASHSFDGVDIDDPVALLLGGIVLLVVLVLTPFLFPVLIGVLEIVLLVVLLPVAVLWRVVGRGTWEVEVRPAHGRIVSGRPVHVERSGGWRSSRTSIRDVAAEIERGERRWQQA